MLGVFFIEGLYGIVALVSVSSSIFSKLWATGSNECFKNGPFFEDATEDGPVEGPDEKLTSLNCLSGVNAICLPADCGGFKGSGLLYRLFL